MLRLQRMRLLLVVLLAFPASALVVTLERDGHAQSGEVCRFAAGDGDDPFLRWLPSQEVLCVASGSLEVPAGKWNLFGRAMGSVSEPLFVDGAALPDRLTLPLLPSATLLMTLPEKRSAVVYLPKRGVAFPAGAHTSVPAGEELWLILLERATPVALVPVAALTEGSVHRVDGRDAGIAAILGWLRLSPADREAFSSARGVSVPRVRASSGGSSSDSDPLPPADRLPGAFVLLRNVSQGDVELEVGGPGWLPYRRRVSVGASPLTVVPQALPARAASSVIVHWSTTDDDLALERSLGGCEDGQFGPFEITLSSCAAPARPNDGIDPASCQPVRNERFTPEARFGSFAVDGIAPGWYRAEMLFGKLPPAAVQLQAPPFAQREARLHPNFEPLYGNVTLGGEPLTKDAELTLPGGKGFASEEKGEYQAAILGEFGTDAELEVVTCDGSLRAIVLAEQPSPLRGRFDIDIPANELEVQVIDTFTRMSLPDTTVSVGVSDKFRRRTVFTRLLKTDHSGRAALKLVPERQLRIEVSRSGYQKQLVPPLTMPRSGAKVVEVQLVPLRGNNGRIVSPSPFDSGVIFWTSAPGRVTERADLAADGSFVYAAAHALDETMTVVSRSHPLWIQRSPTFTLRTSEPVSIPFPGAAPRSFEVFLEQPDPPALIGLLIGGLRVPMPALHLHQSLRELGVTTRSRLPLVLRDIAATAPVDVVRGPAARDVNMNDTFDFLVMPAFIEAPRKRLLPGDRSIVFESLRR